MLETSSPPAGRPRDGTEGDFRFGSVRSVSVPRGGVSRWLRGTAAAGRMLICRGGYGPYAQAWRKRAVARGGAAKSSRIQGNKNTGPLSTPRAGDHRYGRALNSTRPGHGKQPRWGTTDAWPIPPGSLCVGWLTGWSLLRRASSCPLGLSSRRSHYSVVPVPGLPLLGLIDIEQMGAKFDPIASLND